jgi:hypothetical protein
MVEGEISFGQFRLDLARRELRRDEKPVRLGPGRSTSSVYWRLPGEKSSLHFLRNVRSADIAGEQALWGVQPIGLIHGDLPKNAKIDMELLKLG